MGRGTRGGCAGFNPRPLLLTGESWPAAVRSWWGAGFNPRPLLLTGESATEAEAAALIGLQVSIHARYC